MEDDPPLDFRIAKRMQGSALHRTALPGDSAEFLSRSASTEGRLCGSREAGWAMDVADDSVELGKGSQNKDDDDCSHRGQEFMLGVCRRVAGRQRT